MGKYHYRVLENTSLTPTVRSLTLECGDDMKPLLFEPGQYATISLHDLWRPTTTRCFSVASSPSNRRVLEFGVRVSGEYTSALQRLKKGDAVTVRGPFGSFVLREHKHSDLVFFAGGIGITPFMSMIRHARDLRLQNRIHLIYSCRNQDDIPYFEELILAERNNPFFRVTFVIGSGNIDRLINHTAISGRIDKETIARFGFTYQHETFMMCGPSGYLEAMQKLLEEQGVPRSNILSESFNQTAHNQISTAMRWPVNMYALSGFSFLLASFLIVSNDLSKTIPKLEAEYEPIEIMIGGAGTGSSEGGGLASLEAIPPQVDTNITPPPIINQVVRVEAVPVEAAVVAKPAPAPTPIQPVVVSKPDPVPTPTVKPTTRPKTQVS